MISQSLLIVGAVIHVVAWFLPTYEHRDNTFGAKSVTLLYGWQAFWYALRSEGFSFLRFLNTGSALTNLVVVAALLDVSPLSRTPHPSLRIALVACALVNTNWWFRAFKEKEDSLRIGYYWWAGSFFLIAAGLATRWSIATSWISMHGISQTVLAAISAAAVLAGIYVEVKRRGVAETDAPEEGSSSGSAASKIDDPNAPSNDTDTVHPNEPPARRGSYWLLFGGIAGALLAWVLMSWTPRPNTNGSGPSNPRKPQPLAVSSSPPAQRPTSHNDSADSRPNFTPSIVLPAGAPPSTETASLAVAALRPQARDLRRNLDPFLADPTLRAAAISAEKSLGRGEALLQSGRPELAAPLFKDVASKLDDLRASANRNKQAQRVAQQDAQQTTLARQRFKPDQAIQYAESSYSRGQQWEANADAAYRSHDYRRASLFYASAREEYDSVLVTIVQRLSAEEQLRRQREEQEQEAARLLREEQARQLQRQREQEREQALRAHNALRAKATGQIHKVHLDLVSYGGGLNPELEILTEFEVSGMTGVDGVVIVFLYLQQGNTYVRLVGSGNFQNGAYVSATYTPSETRSQFSKFRLAVPLSRLTLPDGTNHIRASVYLRTGGGGQLERDLDAKSADITFVRKSQ